MEAVEAQRSRAEAAACEKASMQAWQRLGVAAPNGDGQSVLIPKNIKATDVKLLVRKGIPAVLRPAAWLQLSGGSALQAAAGEGHYRMLSSQTEGVSGAIIDAIDADVSLQQQHSLDHAMPPMCVESARGCAHASCIPMQKKFAPPEKMIQHLCLHMSHV